jgi:transposase-like protein
MNNFYDPPNRPPPAADMESPSRCPACAAETIATTGKTADADSYWRCLRCGEVWNPARRQRGRPGYRERR